MTPGDGENSSPGPTFDGVCVLLQRRRSVGQSRTHLLAGWRWTDESLGATMGSERTRSAYGPHAQSATAIVFFAGFGFKDGIGRPNTAAAASFSDATTAAAFAPRDSSPTPAGPTLSGLAGTASCAWHWRWQTG
jgi:hypothetical protein